MCCPVCVQRFVLGTNKEKARRIKEIRDKEQKRREVVLKAVLIYELKEKERMASIPKYGFSRKYSELHTPEWC